MWESKWPFWTGNEGVEGLRFLFLVDRTCRLRFPPGPLIVYTIINAICSASGGSYNCFTRPEGRLHFKGSQHYFCRVDRLPAEIDHQSKNNKTQSHDNPIMRIP